MRLGVFGGCFVDGVVAESCGDLVARLAINGELSRNQVIRFEVAVQSRKDNLGRDLVARSSDVRPNPQQASTPSSLGRLLSRRDGMFVVHLSRLR